MEYHIEEGRRIKERYSETVCMNVCMCAQHVHIAWVVKSARVCVYVYVPKGDKGM